MNGYSAKDNPNWDSVQFLMNRPQHLTAKESQFLFDLNRRGASYQMSEKQILWLNSIKFKVRKKEYELEQQERAE